MLSDAVVLVVDDEADFSLLISRWLIQSGARVLSAKNGAEALFQLDGIGADAIVTDLHMPVMDGLELLATVKSVRPGLPVFLMTAANSMSHREATAMGADDLLCKPFTSSNLIEALRRAIPHR